MRHRKTSVDLADAAVAESALGAWPKAVARFPRYGREG